MGKLEKFYCLFSALEAICATKVGTDDAVSSLDLLFVFSKEEIFSLV